jgi:hypothetical protein
MSSTARQNNLLLAEDWQKIYQSFRNADFSSYDFDNLRRTMIDYIRTNFPEDFNDYIESSEYLALIDLIAFVGQSIAFRVDLNARENFLELAERRDSILRLARLVSYNPSRNNAAKGLLKFNTIQTTENVIDSNGRNLSGQYITWNDSSNPNWYDQFIKVINAAFPQTQQFGNPADSATIYGVPTAQYRFNTTNTDVPIYGFTKTVAGRSMNFEITSTTFNGETFIYEEPPKIGNNIACVYTDDGYGAGSPGTGFFFNFTQGTLNTGTFTVTNPSSNETIDVATQNINNTDVWLYSLNQSTGLENTLWTQVPALTGNNVIYNSLNQKNKTIYSALTKANDAITLAFSDGTFGNLPLGAFRIYYRVSNNLAYTITPADIVNVLISIPYTSSTGQAETLSLSLSLATSVTNATQSETNASIKTNAPQTYYTQNRMVTGEDYNISPLAANLQVTKVKAINRTSSGISRYFDLTDPTGKYSSTNLFADDGVIYQQTYTAGTSFSYVTQTDIQGIIDNTVLPLLTDTNLRNFYYQNFVNYLTSSLNVFWYSKTIDSNSSTGSIGISATSLSPVGTYTLTDLKYVTPGALIKFTAPSGYYFNTKKNNVLTAGTATVSGAVSYLWAEVISVSGDGTASLASGLGPITLSKAIPSGAKLDQIIPEFSTTLTPSVVTQMIDLIFSNASFGLRYDGPTQSWQIVFEGNLNISAPFNLANQGDSTNTQQDASWFLAFTTDTEKYTITERAMRYVFESNSEVTFYFDSNNKIYDATSGKTISDIIKVLNINTQPDSVSAFTVDYDWQIVSAYIGKDGYVDPKKVVVTFADPLNTGAVDNPQLFLDIVEPSTNPSTKYIVEEKYTITEGQEDYKYVKNDSTLGPVIILSSKSAAYPLTQWNDGQYLYFVDTQTVVQYIKSTSTLNPTLDYKVYAGRDNLRFQYIHSADYDSRIDPGSSNIIDIYVLTNSYDIAFRQWVDSGAIGTEPLPPSQDSLNSLLSPNLNLIKSISDEIVYHPVYYTLLFGSAADPSLQATFDIMINPNSVVSAANVTARALAAINQFFALENWDFGDTFYFTELSTYVMQQLAPDVISFVIVPTQTGQYFGSLFEIQCPSDSIFLSCATTANIRVVSGLTSSNLKTITGSGLGTLTNSQQITSANYGANS